MLVRIHRLNDQAILPAHQTDGSAGFDLTSSADVTIAPASDDLLAQPLLESMAVGTPVLTNAANAAAVEHCRRANGGLYYANRDEFAEAMRTVMSNSRIRQALGENGRRYVQQNYRWESVLGRFDRLVAKIRPKSA